MSRRAKLEVEGIVQGVGFRPFCYRTATQLGLAGSVRNTGDAGVKITLEGKEKNIKEFANTLKKDNPPIARVDKVKINWKKKTAGLEKFEIRESDREKSGRSSVIPPDVGLCDECLEELMNPDDRRYLYPFITCVNCGPRFTVIEELPYDRERTSMRKFPLCNACRTEYENPADRRYHAEPTCCSENGPQMKLYDSNGSKIDSSEPIRKGAELLDKGKIVAIKGIGGMHIATKTTENTVLEKLRGRFRRPEQPLAIMARDLSTVKKFAKVNEREKELITSSRRPITILKKKDDFPLSDLISPGLDSVGVMLPYSGIHYLLFHYGKSPAYVMTSANLSGLPMIIKNSEAFSELSEKVDYFLLHDRRIVNRCDDSVVRLSGGSPTLIRRSRGHVPIPIRTKVENKSTILALGADLDNTISYAQSGKIFPSQYIGDLENLETINYLKETVQKFSRLLDTGDPKYVVCDLHPEFNSSEIAAGIAEENEAELIRVQHHKAHLYSLMAEHGLNNIIGISADGVGYGEDGTIWGGEVIKITSKDAEKIGGIKKYKLPGGDLATKYPARTLSGILWNDRSAEEIKHVLKKYCQERIEKREIGVVIKQLENDLNAPKTSSAGRTLDAISCLLGVCGKRTYEGEPALKLEAFANRGESEKAELEAPIVKENGNKVIDVGGLISEIIREMENETKREHIAAAAQKKLGEALADIAIESAQENGIEKIAGSGGVFYNDSITRSVQKNVTEEGLEFFKHKIVPPGDGGISVGQAFSVMENK